MATIQDVADLALVSKSTVSYAFNKPHLVSAATLDRILDAAHKLNYQPNVFAQGLAAGKTQMIGLLVPDIRYPFNATVARGIEDSLREAGYIVIVTSTGGDPDEIIKLMGQLHRRGVSGFILVPSFFGISTELVQAIKTLRVGKVPVIIAGYPLHNSSIDHVSYQPQAATKTIVDHLIDLGHSRIGYIGAIHSDGHAINRYLGYQESHFYHRLDMDERLIIQTNITPKEIHVAMDKLMALPEPPTAIFALNDVVTFAILDYCQMKTIAVPQQLSIASFDYQPFVQRITPGVTGAVIPVYEVGQASAELLLNRLEDIDYPTQHIDLNYEFVVRETTAPPSPPRNQTKANTP